MIQKYLLVIIYSFIRITNAAENQCLILALEGGGDRGAYQAGAIKAFVDNLPASELKYDLFSGISVGSLNAASLSLFEVGDERNASDFLLQQWRNISNWKDIYTHYSYLGIPYSVLFKKSLYDTSPLKNFLTSIFFNKTLKRDFQFGATNIKTGKFDSLSGDKDKFTNEQAIDAVMSSSALPFLFPPINYNNNTYVDGSVKAFFDVPSAISKCRDKGFEDKDIVVDIILLYTSRIGTIDPTNMTSLLSVGRAFQIMEYDIYMKNLYEIHEIFENITIRYVVRPSGPLASGLIPINFNHDQIEKMIQLGFKDAENVIKQGKGTAFKSIINDYIKEKYEALQARMTVKTQKPKKFLTK